MRNILLTICYDGSNYHGFQIQDNALTVQEVFQDALGKIVKEHVDIKGCSRTDAGVHAYMYCISMKIESKIPCNNLVMALNRFLPKDVSVLSAQEVPIDFHARYSCLGKEYIYKIWNARIRNPFMEGRALHYWYPMDINSLNEAGLNYIGTHDFTSFSTLDKREIKDMTRTVTDFKVEKEGNLVIMRVSANGFLYNMVRIMVGTLIHVAMGKINPQDIAEIILCKNRKYAGPTAVPYGLYLNKVFYSEMDLKKNDV